MMKNQSNQENLSQLIERNVRPNTKKKTKKSVLKIKFKVQKLIYLSRLGRKTLGEQYNLN